MKPMFLRCRSFRCSPCVRGITQVGALDLLVSFSTIALFAPIHFSVTRLAWLAGSWTLQTKNGQQEEVWTVPSGGSMLGMMRVVSSARTTQREFNIIEESADGTFLTLAHFGPDLQPLVNWPVKMKMTRCTDTEAVFENPTADRLRKIFYRKETDGSITAGVTIMRDGQTREVTFAMKRAAQ